MASKSFFTKSDRNDVTPVHSIAFFDLVQECLLPGVNANSLGLDVIIQIQITNIVTDHMVIPGVTEAVLSNSQGPLGQAQDKWHISECWSLWHYGMAFYFSV